MAKGKEKLSQDLVVLAAMAAEMDAYLRADTLFWRMQQGQMPMLTLGGYLQRQHRLLALQDDLLDSAQRRQLQTAVSQFETALTEKIVRSEQKATTEVEARLRQWQAYLTEAEWRNNPSYNNYPAAVEPRAMLAALLAFLAQPPYELQPGLPAQLDRLDGLLRARWRDGDFTWAPAWQPAYPQNAYWWLYGRPF